MKKKLQKVFIKKFIQNGFIRRFKNVTFKFYFCYDSNIRKVLELIKITRIILKIIFSNAFLRSIIDFYFFKK